MNRIGVALKLSVFSQFNRKMKERVLEIEKIETPISLF
jgi:hypothetical protein